MINLIRIQALFTPRVGFGLLFYSAVGVFNIMSIVYLCINAKCKFFKITYVEYVCNVVVGAQIAQYFKVMGSFKYNNTSILKKLQIGQHFRKFKENKHLRLSLKTERGKAKLGRQ